MTSASFQLSPWNLERAAELEAWGHDRREVLQAGLDAVLALIQGEDLQRPSENGPLVPLRGEGDTTAALFGDLLDDLMAQIAVHGSIQAAALDGVLKRDREGFVAWGYLSPQDPAGQLATFERVGDVQAVTETPDEIRLRVTLRRMG